jgi:hypothetical protein
MYIINIEKSPLRNRRYRIFLSDGDYYDIGFKSCYYYVDTGDHKVHDFFYKMMTNKERNTLLKLIPCQLLYESFILNGYSTDLIKNINFFNKEILDNKLLGNIKEY